MNRIAKLFLILSLACLSGCGRTSALEEMALGRLPAALEEALREQQPDYTGVRMERNRTLYASDSLYVVLCDAAALDAAGEKVRFSVRYAFLKDVIMSATEGHAVYLEAISGNPPMNRKDIAETKQYMAEKASQMYLYYIAIATPLVDNR